MDLIGIRGQSAASFKNLIGISRRFEEHDDASLNWRTKNLIGLTSSLMAPN